jgi:hypothetical protein
MGFNDLLKTVEASPIYKDFIKSHPKAKLCVGFFVLDFVGTENKQTLDYSVGKNIFTFSIAENDEIVMAEDKLVEQKGAPKLKEIKKEVKIDIDELKSIVGIKALDEGIHSKLQKIIAVLQTLRPDEKKKKETIMAWNLTCMLEGLGILHVLVDSNTREIIKFEKKSMMDFIKKTK